MYMRFITLILILLQVIASSTAEAGIRLRPAVSDYQNEVGIGVSYGIKLDNDASFIGYAPDYLRVLSDKWLLNLSIAYDEETEIKDGTKKVTESWTPSVMLGYQVSPNLAVGAGLGHGLRTNEDGAGWKSVSFGDDLSIAGALALTIWNSGRHGLSLSVSLEYNISDGEPSVSTDIGYGWGY